MSAMPGATSGAKSIPDDHLPDAAAEPAELPRRFRTHGREEHSASPEAALEARLGHRFARPELLELALTHRSHTYEAGHGVPAVILPARPDQRDQRNTPGTDNEQMEFLGDAVLGLVVTDALFREFPQCSEGELTRLRSNLVSRQRMAEFGTELGLAEALRLGRSAEQNGGRRKPALLANAAEAVLAAVYLDVRQSGGDGVAAVQALAERFLVQPELAAMRAAVNGDTGRGALRDHKTLLQERVQAAGAGRLRYIDVAQSGPAHQRMFVVKAQLEVSDGVRMLASAEGSSKKEAQQRAAELALAGWSAAVEGDHLKPDGMYPVEASIGVQVQPTLKDEAQAKAQS